MPALPPGFKVTKRVALPPGFKVRKPKTEPSELDQLNQEWDQLQGTTPEYKAEFSRLQKEHPEIEPEITGKHPGQQINRTLESIGQVYPALDVAGRMVMGGVTDVVAKGTGLARTAYGLATGQGLDPSLQAGDRVGKSITKAMTPPPLDARSQELGEAVAYPFTKLQQGADAVADSASKAGYPNVAATIAMVPEAAMTLTGAKWLKGAHPTTALMRNALVKNARKTKQLVTGTMNKAIKPKFKSKKTTTKVKEYENKSLVAVEEITKGKNELGLVDESGRPEARLPESVVDFQESISQTKERVFTEFTEAAEGAGKKGIRVDTEDAGRALDEIINDEVTSNFSPKIVEYAIERQNMLNRMSNAGSLGTKPGGLTPLQTQQAIKQLNITLQAYERSPSVANYSTAMVDAVIVNNLRKALDDSIQGATGKDYQALKNKYSALKAIEDDVNKMANVERNKAAGMLLPDFTDIIAGHQVVSGLMSGSPATLAGGIFVKGMSLARKAMKNPNTKIKKMFKMVDKNLTEQAILKAKIAERSR